MNPQPRRALALQHLAFEDLDGFAPALAAAGYRLETALAPDGLPRSAVDADLLIVLGGPIGANDEALYPFLTEELALIERFLAAGKPLMGICLGAQLIARATGARVYRAARPEIGLAPIELTEAGRRSCLAPFTSEPLTLHWHGDTFELPAGAEHLASSAVCENQAFHLGPKVIGFQFHPEATLGTLERWLVGHAVELAQAGIDVVALREAAASEQGAFVRKADRIMTRWLAGLDG